MAISDPPKDGENEEPAQLGRTMKAAHQVAKEGKSNDIIKAREMVEARFGRGQSPSLTARRTLALLIGKAAGDAWKAGTHSITKRELRGTHKGNERINETLDELMDVKFRMETTSARGRAGILTAALLAWNIEEMDDDGLATVEYEFTEPARQVLQGSDHYARLNRTALLAFQSKYSVTLYELGCLLVGRKDRTERMTVEDLRDRLGVPPGTYENWKDFRKQVLERAGKEIDQVAHFTISWREIKRHRRVAEVQLAVDPKPSAGVNAAAEELDRHSAGRKARREGTVERVHEGKGMFPAGGIRFTPYGALAQKSGGGWDVEVLANAFRKMLESAGTSLTNPIANLEDRFAGFCERYVEKHGKP